MYFEFDLSISDRGVSRTAKASIDSEHRDPHAVAPTPPRDYVLTETVTEEIPRHNFWHRFHYKHKDDIANEKRLMFFACGPAMEVQQLAGFSA